MLLLGRTSIETNEYLVKSQMALRTSRRMKTEECIVTLLSSNCMDVLSAIFLLNEFAFVSVLFMPRGSKCGRAQLNKTSLIPLIAGNKGNLVVRVRNESGKGIRMTDGNDAHFRLH